MKGRGTRIRRRAALITKVTSCRLEGLSSGTASARRLVQSRDALQHVQGAEVAEKLTMLLTRFVRLQGEPLMYTYRCIRCEQHLH